METENENPAWPPAPTYEPELQLTKDKKPWLTPSILPGIAAGSFCYGLGLAGILILYVVLVFVGVGFRQHNPSIYIMMFQLKNYIWCLQRFIVLAISLLPFLFLRKRRFPFAIGFLVGSVIMFFVLLGLYPYVPLEK